MSRNAQMGGLAIIILTALLIFLVILFTLILMVVSHHVAKKVQPVDGQIDWEAGYLAHAFLHEPVDDGRPLHQYLVEAHKAGGVDKAMLLRVMDRRVTQTRFAASYRKHEAYIIHGTFHVCAFDHVGAFPNVGACKRQMLQYPRLEAFSTKASIAEGIRYLMNETVYDGGSMGWAVVPDDEPWIIGVGVYPR